MARLVYFSTNGVWLDCELGERARLGRHPDCDLQLLDRLISKVHAEILRENGHYVIVDLQSKNGTRINDTTIEAPTVLKDGDEIAIGTHVLRFCDDQRGGEASAMHVDEAFDSTKLPSVKKGREAPQGQGVMAAIWRRVNDGFLPETEIESERALRRDYEKLRIGSDLAKAAATALDVEALLNIVKDKVFELFCADRVSILLKDETGEMTPRLAVNRNGESIHHFKISESLLNEVIERKSAVLSPDALCDARFADSHSIVFDNVRSSMCVPLMYGEDIFGVINLDTQVMTGAFTEKDLEILTGFAHQAALTIQQSRLAEEMRQNEVIRNNLRRMISPHLVDDVMCGKMELKKSGRRVKATVLFADIRGFSRMTEQTQPENIVGMLNEFFETMVDCIFKHDGVVDKFVGDEVMAVWGVNVSAENHVENAVLTAIDMMAAIRAMNDERESQMLPPIALGIGIATGVMIAGYMGSTQAMSYTVIGDTVNLGSRLCSAAQGGEILINAEAWEAIEGKIGALPLPPIMVKGRKEPVMLYRIQC